MPFIVFGYQHRKKNLKITLNENDLKIYFLNFKLKKAPEYLHGSAELYKDSTGHWAEQMERRKVVMSLMTFCMNLVHAIIESSTCNN